MAILPNYQGFEAGSKRIQEMTENNSAAIVTLTSCVNKINETLETENAIGKGTYASAPLFIMLLFI